MQRWKPEAPWLADQTAGAIFWVYFPSLWVIAATLSIPDEPNST